MQKIIVSPSSNQIKPELNKDCLKIDGTGQIEISRKSITTTVPTNIKFK